MAKNILIISSDKTGHGHKSITEALCEQVQNQQDVNLHIIDGFALGDKALMKFGTAYGSITRKSESLWGILWKLSSAQPTIVNKMIQHHIEKRFLEILKEFKPDIILSVHPNFNGSVLNILEKHQINLPFIIFIADLVNISSLWVDRRASSIICPTYEARQKCIEFGMPLEKIKVLGFPIRSRFFRKKDNPKLRYQTGSTLNCLVMSGGEGVGNMADIATTLLNYFDCHVKIVAGRNEKLKKELEDSLKGEYGDKVEIYGFTQNIQDLMFSSDIAFTRGSPNTMLEAVATNTPLILTGALPGQEADNPAFAEKYNVGRLCHNNQEMIQLILEMIENDGLKLNEMVASQKKFMYPCSAENILKFIFESGEPALEEVLSYEAQLELNGKMVIS